MENAVNMQSGEVIIMDSVPVRTRNCWCPEDDSGAGLKHHLLHTEREILTMYLAKIADGTLTKGEVARILSISRITLHRKLKRYNLRGIFVQRNDQ